MERVNFFKDVRIHEACAKNDDLRPSLGYILFDGGYMYASNNRVLVRNRVEDCCTLPDDQIRMLDGKFLHWRSYKEILKRDYIVVLEDGIKCCDGDWDVMYRFGNSDCLKFPNVKKVINDVMASESCDVSKFSVNERLLAVVRKAMFPIERNISYTFRNEGKSIVCEGDCGSVAIVALILDE